MQKMKLMPGSNGGRINRKMDKFKIGDWIKCKCCNQIMCITRVQEDRARYMGLTAPSISLEASPDYFFIDFELAEFYSVKKEEVKEDNVISY